MTDDLIDRIFEIQRKIDKFVFPRYGGMDQGMFTAKDQQSQTVFWRDNACWNDEDNIYQFAFSSDGEYQGELPPDCADEILAILEEYKR
jgi:hypothetical protein